MFAINLNAQEISVNTYQDVGLATKVDSYGNTPFTTDLIIKTKLHLNPVYISFNYEYVDLASGYFQRPSLGIGVCLTYKFLEFSNELNYGILARPFSESYNYSLDTEVAVVIKRFKIIGMIQVMNRTDYNKPFTRLSGFLGIGYVIKTESK